MLGEGELDLRKLENGVGTSSRRTLYGILRSSTFSCRFSVMEVSEQVNTIVAICMILFLERHCTWMSLVKGAMSG